MNELLTLRELPLLPIVFVCFGLAYIVGHARVSLPIREAVAQAGVFGRVFVELLECPACFGFWEGVALAFVLHRVPLLFILGCFTAATNLILGRYCGLIGDEEP